MKIESMKVGPRTMLTFDGAPAMVQLVMRASTSAPSRVKCALAIATIAEDGEALVAPLPFARATLPEKPGRKASGWTPEWRMEMN